MTTEKTGTVAARYAEARALHAAATDPIEKRMLLRHLLGIAAIAKTLGVDLKAGA
jgi:hypothetical protein